MWSIYLLYHPVHKRSYIGSTVDVKKRLRQHNQEIKGGAKATSSLAPGWTLKLQVTGFKTRSEACRWEKIIKMRAIGIYSRAAAFRQVAAGECPTSEKYKIFYRVPQGLTLIEH